MRYLSYLSYVFLSVFILAINWYCINNIDFFDYSLTDLGFANWHLAPYLSRLSLGILGAIPLLSFALHSKRKSILTIGVALSICMFLITISEVLFCKLERPYLALYELWPISKWQGGIWLVYAIVGFLLSKDLSFTKPAKLTRIALGITALVITVLPFILNYPPSWAIYGEQAEENSSMELQLDSVFQMATYKQFVTSAEQITEGKKIICFASLTCPYCSRLAYKLHIIKERNPKAAMLLVLTGNPQNIARFERKSNCSNVPRVFIGSEYFARWFGGNVPIVFQANGSKTLNKLEYWALSDVHF
jgi:hypothetical protein